MPGFAVEKLDEEDVRLLVRHPDGEIRARAATRICRTVRDVKLSDAERKFARKLLAYMAEDATAIVRRSLAITLRNSPELPRDVARTLALDVDNVAVPILENSPVFSDEDLIEILRSKAAAKILAVAKRPRISGNIVRAIVRYGDSRAVAEVAANDGAIIDADIADNILDIYHNDDLITEAFISRRDLPISVMEKLITIISEEAAILLQSRHSVPAAVAVNLANRTRERATLAIADMDLGERDTILFVKRLKAEGRLTPSILVRAAGVGHMLLLRHGLALMVGVSPAKAGLMIHDSGPFGLKALCGRANFSENETRLIRAACVIFRDLEVSGLEYDQSYFRTLMTQRMLTLPIDLPDAEATWFLEYLDAVEGRLVA
jgi:uncharacterized protein (DUF2336 family)